MSNGNGKAGTVPLPPRAYYDFYKTSGADTAVLSGGPSLTRQEFAEECDINVLMARYETVGALPANVLAREPMFYDFTSKPDDLMQTMDMLAAARDAFMTLPARVRKEFDNDPVVFVDFASRDENLDQMRAWGLAAPVEAPPVPSAPAGAPAAPAAPSASQAPGAASTQVLP